MTNKIEYAIEFNARGMEDLLQQAKDVDKAMQQVRKAQTKQSKDFQKHQEKQTQQVKYYENEKIQIQKQVILSSGRLKRKHLQQLEQLYRDYYTKIKDLDAKSADDLAKQQVVKHKKMNQKQSLAYNVPGRVAKYLATATGTIGAVNAMKDIVRANVEYDQVLHNILSIMPKLSQEERKRLNLAIADADLVKKYGTSYIKQAESFEVLTKAGLTLNESMVMLEPSLGLAKVSGEDFRETTQRLIEMLNGFGQPMGSATELVDLLAKGASESSIDVKDLADSLEVFAPVSKAFGMSMRESIAWLSALGKAGLKGREAANGLSRDLLRLSRDQKELNHFFVDKVTGIDKRYDQQTGRLKSLDEILQIVADSEMSLAEKQQLLGVHAFKTNAQIEVSIQSYKELLPLLKDASGELERQSNIKMEGLQERLNKLKATWESIWVSDEGAISVLIGRVADLITNTLEFYQTFESLGDVLKHLVPGYGRYRKFKEGDYKGAFSLGSINNPGSNSKKMYQKDFAGLVFEVLEIDTEGLYKTWRKASNVRVEQKKHLDETKKMLKEEAIAYEEYNNKLKQLTRGALSEERKLLKQRLKELEIDVKEQETKLAKLKNEETFGFSLLQKDIKSIKEVLDISKRIDKSIFKAQEQAKVNKELEKTKKEIVAISKQQSQVDTEIALREQHGAKNTGSGIKQKYNDLASFFRELQKMTNRFSERNMTDLDRLLENVENRYDEMRTKLEDIIRHDKEQGVETQNIGEARELLAMYKAKVKAETYAEDVRKQWGKKAKERVEKAKKDERDAFERKIKAEEEYANAVKQYGTIRQKFVLDMLDEETTIENARNNAKIVGAQLTEEMITNIKKEHHEQRIQMAMDAFEKEHEFAMNAMNSISEGWDSMADGFADDLKLSQNELETVWQSIKSSFVKGVFDIVKEYIKAGMMKMLFQQDENVARMAMESEYTVSAITNSALRTVALKTEAQAAREGAMWVTLLTGGMNSAGAIAGLTAFMTAMNGANLLQKGLADAIVADGKVYPYRKDDLVLLGTNILGSRGGSSIPKQASVPQGVAGNNAIISELKALRMAVSSGNAGIERAVVNSQPIFTGQVLGNVDIYKASTLGKQEANFAFSPV